MRGNITRRGKSSWRLKFDVGFDEHGRRRTRNATVKGKRADAEAELARLLNEYHRGTLLDPSNVTVGEYLRAVGRAQASSKAGDAVSQRG